MCKECQELVKAIDAYIEKADKKLEDQLKAANYVRPKETLEYALRMEEELAGMIDQQTQEFIDALKSAGDVERFYRNGWKGFTESQGLSAQFTTVFHDNFKKMIPQFVGYYIDEIDAGLARDLVSKRTTAWIERWSGELGRMMHLSSINELENILKHALSEGLSVADATLEIMDAGIRNPYYKARRVAVTEMLRAHSVAAQEAQMQAPSVSQKMWVHTGAHKNEPRENHMAISGQTVPVDQPYELIGADGGSYSPMYPRDGSLPASESVNCHCISQPVVDESVLGLSVEERRALQAEAVVAMDKQYDAENK